MNKQPLSVGQAPGLPSLNRRASRLPRAHAFTLIEVLIAVIIIGLGMIGISALFAGAARQQQIVSQSSRTTTAARNAEAKVLELFTGLRDVNDVADCTYGGDTTLVQPEERLTVEWTPVFADNNNTLSVALRPRNFNATTACTALYFERPLPEITLLDNTDRFGSRLNSAIDVDGFTGGPAGAVSLPGMNPYFPVRSLIADTIEIDVYIAGTERIQLGDPEFDAPPDGPDGRTIRYTYSYDPADTGAGFPETGEGPCNGHIIRLRNKDRHPRAGSQGWAANEWRAHDFITITAFKCPLERDTDNPEVAFVSAMKIFGVQEAQNPANPIGNPTPRVGRYIQKIVVRNAAYRTLNLLSNSERVLTEASPSGELRDVSALAVMMRSPALPGGSADTNAAQVCVFTYAIQSAADNERYIPRERATDPVNERPIRSALVELVYNAETETYWFFCTRSPEAPASDESWLARSGQTPLFAGDQAAGISGADDSSRVVRVVTLDRNRGYWCELEKAPRAGTGIVGPGLPRVVNALFTPSSTAGSAGVHRVYGVASETISRRVGTTDPGASWRLTPIEARVFSVSR